MEPPRIFKYENGILTEDSPLIEGEKGIVGLFEDYFKKKESERGLENKESLIIFAPNQKVFDNSNYNLGVSKEKRIPLWNFHKFLKENFETKEPGKKRYYNGGGFGEYKFVDNTLILNLKSWNKRNGDPLSMEKIFREYNKFNLEKCVINKVSGIFSTKNF
jgi:hypothetical protein